MWIWLLIGFVLGTAVTTGIFVYLVKLATGIGGGIKEMEEQ